MNQEQEKALAFLQQLAVDKGVQSLELFVGFLNNLILIFNLDLDILNNPDDIVELAEKCEQAQLEQPQEFEEAAALAANPDVPMGRFGMKVYSLMRLRGICPPDFLVSYYKVGGKVCKKCVKKQEAGGKTKKNTGTSIEDYKAEYAQRKADYANLYRHLQSKSVGGAIDAQPKYSGKGPNGISKHRGGGIIRGENGTPLYWGEIRTRFGLSESLVRALHGQYLQYMRQHNLNPILGNSISNKGMDLEDLEELIKEARKNNWGNPFINCTPLPYNPKVDHMLSPLQPVLPYTPGTGEDPNKSNSIYL